MKLDLKIPWHSKDEETRRSTGAEFYGVRDLWNQHDSGIAVWNNVNAFNATIANLTVAGIAGPFLPLAGGTLTGNLIFNPTTAGVKGTTTNDSAAAGNVGEYVTSYTSAVSFPTTNQYGDLTSISLTAGDWMISLNWQLTTNGATVNSVEVGIGLISGNNGTDLVAGDNRWDNLRTAVNADSGSVPPWRLSIASTTTVYYKFFGTYTVATPKGNGRISAWRVR